jgi:transcriptional regulator with XRE-family HTH domain
MNMLGQRIRSARLEAQLSQSDLARWLKCDRAVVCRIEKGSAAPPGPALLKRIADALSADYGDLAYGAVGDRHERDLKKYGIYREYQVVAP